MASKYLFPCLLFLFVSLCHLSQPATARAASSEARVSQGQTLYVAAYSNVFSGPRKRPFQLATTLSLRNTDPRDSLRVRSADYYDTNGKLIRRYLDKPLVLGPLASSYIYIEEKDESGGFGANFIVKWEADKAVNESIIEAVMIGATSGQGISFVSAGQVIR